MGAREVVLASASPARLALLRAAGVDATVVVSDVDEPALERRLATQGRTEPGDVCGELAVAKAAAVVRRLGSTHPDAIVIAADSVLDLDGTPLGKPTDVADARARWEAMAGRSGVLCTGHAVTDRASGRSARAVARTRVRFGRPDPDELAAYLASGEPLRVAGAFTLDGLGSAFIEGIDGDPSTVVGLSIPTLRTLLAQIGVRWTDLWRDS